MQESVRLTPHTHNPQDVLATWHALKALPSQVHTITDQLQRQLTQLRADRQQEMLSLADAKADTVGCLEAVVGHDQSSQAMVDAVRRCMLSAADRVQVSMRSKVFSFCIALTVYRLVAGSCLCMLVSCMQRSALLIMLGTCTTVGSPGQHSS